MSQFVDIGKPLNDPRERLILNTSTIKSFSIVSRMGKQKNSVEFPDTNSEFLLSIELKSGENYFVELDGMSNGPGEELYQPSQPDQVMDEFLSVVIDELMDSLDMGSLKS